MQDFDFTIKHRPGVTHQNADTLSRFPLPTTEDGTGARMDEDEEEHTTGQASALLCRIGQTTTVMTLSAHAPAFRASRRIIAAITSLQGEYPTSNISDTSPTRDDLLGDCHNRSTAPRDSPLMIFTNKPDMHKQTCATSPTAGWSQQKKPYQTLPTTPNLTNPRWVHSTPPLSETSYTRISGQA